MAIKGYDEIEDIAYTLLKKYRVSEPGTPVQEIAEKEGLTLLVYDFGESISGVLFIKDNKGTIGCSTRDSKLRRRFTVAHELGHYCLHWSKSEKSKSDDIFVDKDFIVKFRNNENAYDQEEFFKEQEANAFAAALLMPKFLIEREFATGDYQEIEETEVIAKLAKTFNVSVPAMTYRLINLNFLRA